MADAVVAGKKKVAEAEKDAARKKVERKEAAAQPAPEVAVGELAEELEEDGAPRAREAKKEATAVKARMKKSEDEIAEASKKAKAAAASKKDSSES